MEVAEEVRSERAASEAVEMNTFLNERVTPTVYKFIKSQPYPPQDVEECIKLVDWWIETCEKDRNGKGIRAMGTDAGQDPNEEPGRASLPADGTDGSISKPTASSKHRTRSFFAPPCRRIRGTCWPLIYTVYDKRSSFTPRCPTRTPRTHHFRSCS